MYDGNLKVPNLTGEELANKKLLKLTELVFMGEGVTREEFGRLVKWMPNVEKVEMNVTNELFGIICENWSNNLVDLEVWGSSADFDDEGLTGMKWGDDKLRNGKKLVVLGEKEQSIKPNIGNLQSKIKQAELEF